MPNGSSDSVRVFYPPSSRAALISDLRTRLKSLVAVLPVRQAVLFGSWAKGRATAFSDIDVLIVYGDPPRDNAYQLVWRSLRVRGIEPHVYSESEAARLRSTLDRMACGGVDLLKSVE